MEWRGMLSGMAWRGMLCSMTWHDMLCGMVCGMFWYGCILGLYDMVWYMMDAYMHACTVCKHSGNHWRKLLITETPIQISDKVY